MSTNVGGIFMAIEKGQRYLVNSIHLGIPFVRAVDLIVTIKNLNPRSDGLELSPGLPHGAFPSDPFFSAVRWFATEYAIFPKGSSAVNSLSAFEDLVSRRMAILYEK
jgi:hypothetical protein